MTELYAYYKVPVGEQATAERQVRQAQTMLCGRLPGLQARLLQRADDSTDGQHLTWMEIYTHPAGLDTAAQSLLLQTLRDCPSQRVGERHTEGFRPRDAR